jgi:hypothetical protein
VLTPVLFPLSCTSPMTCEDPGSLPGALAPLISTGICWVRCSAWVVLACWVQVLPSAFASHSGKSRFLVFSADKFTYNEGALNCKRSNPSLQLLVIHQQVQQC